MIVKYIEKALELARCVELHEGRRRDGSRGRASTRTFSATVPGLRGVIAIGSSEKDCLRELAEVVEEWVLVRVARGLTVPKLDGIEVKVKRAG